MNGPYLLATIHSGWWVAYTNRGEYMSVRLKLFYAPWSNRTRAQEHHFERIEEEWQEDCRIERIDVERHQDVADAYEVRTIPTVIVEDESGVIDRFGGVVSDDQLEQCLHRCRQGI